MINSDDDLSRRSVLKALGLLSATPAVSGCLDRIGLAGRPEGVVLDPPSDWSLIKDGDFSHPIYGDMLPDASMMAYPREEEISISDFSGERHVVLTFIFTNCTDICPVLTSNLRHIQADSVSNGYEDEIALLPITFDPQNDTPEVLMEFGDQHGVNWDAGNWFFLRPRNKERAIEVVDETYGIGFQRDNQTNQDGHTDHEHTHDVDFAHISMILIANKDGVVERGYSGARMPNAPGLVNDVNTLVERW